MADYLPPEVLLDILKRLPVKTLLRFRLVSKQWYSLITNPNFISQHLLHTTLHTPPHALVGYCIQDPKNPLSMIAHYSIRLDKEASFDEYIKPEFPLKSSNSSFDIFGCCNGLLGLADHMSEGNWYDLHLWNPLVRKSVAVQFKGSGSYFTCFGFGFDELTNDHKVVAYMMPLAYAIGFQARAEIYSLNSRIWREISIKCLRYPPHCFVGQPINLNGVAHWYVINHRKVLSDPVPRSIMTFSFKDEVFGEMMLPRGESQITPYVMRLQDSLACIHIDENDLCWIWVMENYGVEESWTLLFKVGAPGGFGVPIGFRMNGELVMVMGNSLVSYDPKSEQVKDLVVIKGKGGEVEDYLEYYIVSVYLGRYVESLVLLDRVASAPEHIGPSDRSFLM